MSSNSEPKSTIQQTPAPTGGKAQVNLVKSDFDAAIEQKGYDVHIDKVLRCPCKSKGGGHRADCQNCGGVGYVYINRIKTRLILQHMNLNTEFKDWSEQNRGTATITARDVEELTFMDRITLLNAESFHSENIYPVEYDDKLVAKTIYDVVKVAYIFMFEKVDRKLVRLIEGLDQDYTIEGNLFTLNNKFKDQVHEELTISIRYTHAPQYHIIDMTREVMNTDIRIDTDSGLINVKMPVSAIARRSHYVLDEENFSGTYIFDNSFDPKLDCIVELPVEETGYNPITNAKVDVYYNITKLVTNVTNIYGTVDAGGLIAPVINVRNPGTFDLDESVTTKKPTLVGGVGIFDGVNDQLRSTDAPTVIKDNDDFTVFGVFDVISPTLGTNFVLFQKDSAVNYYQLSSGTSPDITTRLGGSIKRITSDTSLTVGSKLIIQADFKHNDWQAFFNGIQDNTPDGILIAPTGINVISIGSLVGSTSTVFRSLAFRGMIVHNQLITDSAEIASINAFIATDM